MKISTTIVFMLCAMLLALGSCNLLPSGKRPEHGSRAPLPQSGEPGADSEAATDGEAEAGSPSDESDEAGAEAADEASAADSAEADKDAADDSSAAETGANEDEKTTEPASGPAAPAELDLSGDWLALYSRDRDGVHPELWDSGLHYRMNGDRRQLTISPVEGSSFDTNTPVNVPIMSPLIQQAGRFLIVEVPGQSRTAYLRSGEAGTLPEGSGIKGNIGSQQLSGSLSLQGDELSLDLGSGMNFRGKAREGAYFGYLDGGRPRGYLALFVNSKGTLEGILFADPYKDFLSAVDFEVVP